MKVEKFKRMPCPTCGAPRSIVDGAWLRQRRNAAHFSLRDMGARLGLSIVYLSDIERNNRTCPRKVRDAYEAL